MLPLLPSQTIFQLFLFFSALRGGSQSIPRCVSYWKPGLTTAAFEVRKQTPFEERLGDAFFFACSLSAGCWGDSSREFSCPLTIVFLFVVVLWVSWAQALLAFISRCFGGPSFGWESYGLGHQMQGPNPNLQGDTGCCMALCCRQA